MWSSPILLAFKRWKDWLPEVMCKVSTQQSLHKYCTVLKFGMKSGEKANWKVLVYVGLMLCSDFETDFYCNPSPWKHRMRNTLSGNKKTIALNRHLKIKNKIVILKHYFEAPFVLVLFITQFWSFEVTNQDFIYLSELFSTLCHFTVFALNSVWTIEHICLALWLFTYFLLLKVYFIF